MTARGGEIWLDLNPIRGSEQAGTRPVLVFQNDSLNKFTATFLAIPLTTNLRRAKLPSCLPIPMGQGEVREHSVALCHAFWINLDCSASWERLQAKRWKRLKVCVLFTQVFCRANS
jgi:mRNA interferase MazF